MSDSDDPQHRAYHQPDPGDIEVRDLGDDDGTFSIRMPIASTGEVRNEGDDPLTRDEIDGMARQIEERSVGVFLDHGSNMDVAGSRYSAIGKVGEWRSPDLETRDADGKSDLLIADARLMDPATLPPSAGDVREALAVVKSQAEREIGLSSSIGWRDDDSMAGGVDLMEASIVGIPADPRTTTQDSVAAMARAALDERDVDPEQLVAEFRAVVMGPDPNEHDMSDNTDAGDDPGDDRDEQPDDEREAPEWANRMIDILEDVHDAVRADDEDDQPGGDEEDDEDDEEDDEEEDAEQSLSVDGNEVTAEDVREMREQLADADPEDPADGETRDTDADEESTRSDTTDELLTPRK